MAPVETCNHNRGLVIAGPGEVVCPECGASLPLITTRRPKAPDDESSIVSPSMIHPLGSADSIGDLNNSGVLAGSLKKLFDGSDRETFWIRLTEQLKEKGYSEVRIAEIGLFVKRAIAREKSEAWQTVLEVVRLALGVDV
jgi:hypothetical protein